MMAKETLVGSLPRPDESLLAAQLLVIKPKGYWEVAAGRFARQRVSMIAAVALLLITLLALLAPIVTPHDPAKQYRKEGLKGGMPVGPSGQFWLGTDGLGRDMFTRLIYGARYAIGIGILASGISVLIGVLVGSASGLIGGLVDTVVMRFVDIVLSLPSLFVILLLVSIFQPSLWITVCVIAALSWARPSRVFRAEVKSLREREYVTAAQSLGASFSHIFFKHILPQTLPLIIIYIGLGVPGALFAEAGLSFLGLGVPAPAPTWGNMIQSGTGFYRAAPLQVILPGVAIIITVICFNLVGSGLRDALDPTVHGK